MGLINSLWKVTSIWRVTPKLSKYTNVYQSDHKVLQAESLKPYEFNLNNMKNSEATKEPMLPDTSTCVADHHDELSKNSVIHYVRKLMRNPYQSPVIEQGLSLFTNANMLPGNLPEFFTKHQACFIKTR